MIHATMEPPASSGTTLDNEPPAPETAMPLVVQRAPAIAADEKRRRASKTAIAKTMASDTVFVGLRNFSVAFRAISSR